MTVNDLYRGIIVAEEISWIIDYIVEGNFTYNIKPSISNEWALHLMHHT